MSRPEWPDWWVWELELSSHLLKRMTIDASPRSTFDGCSNEPPVTARTLSRGAGSSKRDIEAGRGEVIVEPDRERQLLVVVTAYPLWE